ncbi:MAG: cytochrome c oxidase subunit II [Saprospiraceae bacterium]|nr:cytochrome c oxidase subunit II [Saprospiraceae bacterium]
MTALIIILCITLLIIVAVQIGKISELAQKIRGEEEVEQESNNRSAYGMLLFLVAFLVFCIVTALYYRNYMLGYGPHESASEHGGKIDSIFNITLVITGIVFIITHIALFWFAYKYRAQKGKKVLYIPHDNKLEVIWTIVPAVVMTILVVGGLDAWNEIMADVNEDEDYMEIEATGYQFAWDIRYPGADGVLGARNYKLITATNPIGQDWTDVKNLDDIKPDEIVLPVGMKVRVRITSRDVLHNFYLPHFRVKMDAVPGMPTYFVFTPKITTEEYRAELKKYPEYQGPALAEEPDGPRLWEAFNYELACAELCGSSHFSMRRIVRIVTQDEYDAWIKTQNSFFLTSIRNTDDDPYNGKALPIPMDEKKIEEPASTSGTDTISTDTIPADTLNKDQK